MGEKDKDVLSMEDLEKSWTDSKALLKALLDEDEAPESLKKSEDDKPLFDEEEAEEDADEDEDEEEDVKKSLEDDVSGDEDASAAMDVEPFLRQMVKSISKRFTALEKANAKLSTALVKSLVAMGDQSMTIASTVQAIAETPQGTSSVIRKSMDRFATPEAEKQQELLKSMTTDQVLEKAIKLAKSGKLTSLDVAKIQNRINKNIPLNAEYVDMLTAKEDK